MTTPGSDEDHFPGFDVLSLRPAWDEVTAAVVVGRLHYTSDLKFFSEEQEPTARTLFDRLLAQDDEPKVPVTEIVDERLLAHRTDGYRYDDMPDDWDAFSRSVDALDAEARAVEGRPFADLEGEAQIEILERIRTTEGHWYGMPAKRVFALWMRYACDAFYSHPWAWNEIGFPGPAYPRGYKNLGIGHREPFEVQERDAEDPLA